VLAPPPPAAPTGQEAAAGGQLAGVFDLAAFVFPPPAQSAGGRGRGRQSAALADAATAHQRDAATDVMHAAVAALGAYGVQLPRLDTGAPVFCAALAFGADSSFAARSSAPEAPTPKHGVDLWHARDAAGPARSGARACAHGQRAGRVEHVADGAHGPRTASDERQPGDGGVGQASGVQAHERPAVAHRDSHAALHRRAAGPQRGGAQLRVGPAGHGACRARLERALRARAAKRRYLALNLTKSH